MSKRLLIIFILGFSSGLPLALISSTLQAWYSDAGMSILATGALSLIGLPYVYRFIWGPLLDRYTLFPIGKRRSWMLVMQVLLLVGFNAMAWFSPTTSPQLMAALAFLLACFSATQDVAIDAHRTEYLPQNEHAIGASLAVLGYRLALLVAGGVALIIAQHLGWAIAYRVMGLLMLLGEAFTTTTSGIVMPFLIQGIGFSLDTIAYVNKIMGIGAIILGGVTAGLLLMRWSLYRALLVFGLLQAVTNLLFIALAMVGKNVPLFAVAVVSDNFVAGMGSTALVALFMGLVDKRFTATQFSFFVALSMLPRVLSGPIAAMLQSWFGWVGLYELSFIMAFCFIPFLLIIRKQIRFERVLILDNLPGQRALRGADSANTPT